MEIWMQILEILILLAWYRIVSPILRQSCSKCYDAMSSLQEETDAAATQIAFHHEATYTDNENVVVETQLASANTRLSRQVTATR
jgi:hypothetical protein